MPNIPTTMRGAVLLGHGGPEQLQLRDDLTVPTPGDHDVLVRVLAAGVNNTDLNTRKGWYSKNDGASADASWAGTALPLPLIQGIDGCGEIVACGNQVSSARLGERVLIEPCIRYRDGQILAEPQFFGSECNGAFAQYTCVDHRHAYAVHSTLSDIELASFPCSYSTAENMLTRTQVNARDHVLVTGASGGVGSAAVQLARARGARVSAVTTAAKAEALRALGAADVIDRDNSMRDALPASSVDVVLDLVGGDQWGQLLDVLKPGGRLAVSGAIAGPMAEIDIRTLYLKDLSLLGCTALDKPVFANLVSHIEQGNIAPTIAKVFPLAEIHSAQQMFEQKNYVGKIVLEVA